MLQLTIPATELWDEANEMFLYSEEQTLNLEHSLVSLSKWEMKYHKPFLTKEEKTIEETIYYVKCMTLDENVDELVYNLLTNEHLKKINEYIEDPMSATTIKEMQRGKRNGEQVTNEVIYYWMTALNIPVEYENWHLNRLFTMIRVCNAKNQPPKKMGRRDVMSQNRALNAARRQQYNTKG